MAAIKAEVDIPVAASLGMLTQAQVDDLHDMGVHRYNHNPEAARSYFPQVVTTHSYQERWDTCPPASVTECGSVNGFRSLSPGSATSRVRGRRVRGHWPVEPVTTAATLSCSTWVEHAVDAVSNGT